MMEGDGTIMARTKHRTQLRRSPEEQLYRTLSLSQLATMSKHNCFNSLTVALATLSKHKMHKVQHQCRQTFSKKDAARLQQAISGESLEPISLNRCLVHMQVSERILGTMVVTIITGINGLSLETSNCVELLSVSARDLDRAQKPAHLMSGTAAFSTASTTVFCGLAAWSRNSLAMSSSPNGATV